ncbi:class I SAM-dependent methyltransferase [Micromonospora maris]|uniref:SAM-dependent methyltransferase n=1 Tax=Micromonospora maris TaxID=1003110 RepID=A0A9X0I228_9ACTN|nr:class I SAM-dependent methyltransferase [Micromonospora maris]AEB46041.1 C-methyltransferase [Micromonospora maris AB-18-032]KUJ45333.1 SAM-dependent methyltransferase [Micromonospora maris]
MTSCRICGGAVGELLDLGRQPSANRFLSPEEAPQEYLFRLAIGACDTCTMVQLMEDVPQEVRYHPAYRYLASGSALHRKFFAGEARRLLETELTGPDPFIVEIGCNDGVLLEHIAQAGVRHLGVEPAASVAALAEAKGVTVRNSFFDDVTAAEIRTGRGADVIYGANTICHIAYQDALFRGVDTLLAPDGVFVMVEPYLGTIVHGMAFDQIYDEHVYYFTAHSVRAMARTFGFELVDVEDVPLHGGEIRYTLARPGRRPIRPAVADMLAREQSSGLIERDTLARFARAVAQIREDLVDLLRGLRAEGRTVVGYGAPGKTATVTTYCGIGPDLLPFTCDSTPAKQGLLVPGSHIPVLPPAEFEAARPDYALLFAWNHAEEIMAKEKAFRDRGGRWIRYVPRVRVD